MAIDMETATIFTVGFANEIPTGATSSGFGPANDFQPGLKPRKVM